MKFFDVRQGSPEWFDLRKGRPTASNFDKILTPAQGKPSSQSEGYIDELIAEMMLEEPPEGLGNYLSRPMLHGMNTEAEARRYYEMDRRCTVTNGGFCMDDDGRFGCSPDGLVGDDGAIELKCPQGKTQIGYLRAGVLPVEYRWQCHGHLVVTGRAWCDFLSYVAGGPPLLIRVERNKDTNKLAAALVEFWHRYAAALAQIQTMAGYRLTTRWPAA